MPGRPAEVLPSIFFELDGAAGVAQRHHFRTSSARLLLSILGAIGAAVTAQASGTARVVAGSFAAAAFLATFAVELSMLVSHPERAWYEGRARAESIRTLVWRFAVRARPFDGEDAAAERELDAVTQEMRALRAARLDVRRAAYLEKRLSSQRQWFAQKSSRKATQAVRLRVAMLVIEALGVSAALLEAFGALGVPLSGIASAMIAAGAAWLGAGQHEATARSYALAASRLDDLAGHLQAAEDEHGWCEAVTATEDTLTREHEAWHGARTAKRLPLGF